jgi:hypothetical protein
VLATLRRSAEGDQAGFLRMQSQSKAPQPLPEHLQHTACIVLSLKGDHKVIGITNQGCLAA